MAAVAVIATGLLAGPAPASAAVSVAAPASAAVSVAAPAFVSAACGVQRVGDHWNCVTPGAYCPAAAHGKYGYDKYKGRKYRCVRYSNGKWRWKRA
ncbi:hypothetical protein [Microtetraspora glauca]|uniref:Uncharacterized protein n=1 Tax=Microtetraspora glauca TaxID=1996 RepID=A0ABV3GIK0_MICGL